jgi:hypothetical protein
MKLGFNLLWRCVPVVCDSFQGGFVWKFSWVSWWNCCGGLGGFLVSMKVESVEICSFMVWKIWKRTSQLQWPSIYLIRNLDSTWKASKFITSNSPKLITSNSNPPKYITSNSNPQRPLQNHFCHSTQSFSPQPAYLMPSCLWNAFRKGNSRTNWVWNDSKSSTTKLTELIEQKIC